MCRLVLVLTSATLALAACERRGPGEDSVETPPTASPAFRHQWSGDVSGGYRPVVDHAGVWRIIDLYVGQESAFRAWEAGDHGVSPLVLTLRGPGGEARITPTAYRAEDELLRFEGDSARTGPVVFEGRLDPGALATARRNLDDRTAVVTGTLTVGGDRQAVALGWWGGD